MIIVMKADTQPDSPELAQVIQMAEGYPGVSTQIHRIEGATRSVTEVYLLGSTGVVPTEPFEEFTSVERVVRVTEKFRSIGRHGAGLGPLVTVGLGLLTGGAIGNLIDRVRFGHVIDFVDMGIGDMRWYAWNISDAAVFLGIVALFVAALLGDRAPRAQTGSPA